jgi:TetR/AcrR family transcriptional regulator, transcriptional repressor for nem operon
VKVGRPKGYDRDRALAAARDLFWERGYEATSISDLEQRTGLNRSSMYQEFGNKRELFDAALACYLDQVIAPLLADLREPDAGFDALVAFFTRLGRLFRAGTAVATRGCLLVNSIAELAATQSSIRPAASAYRDRLRTTFGQVLANAAARGEADPTATGRRAQLLASTLMGIWLAVRIDADDAASLCDAVAVEIESWRTAPSLS